MSSIFQTRTRGPFVKVAGLCLQARADVALSVAMTTVSTLLAVAATPLLTKLLVGQLVPVSVGALLLSTLQVRATTEEPPGEHMLSSGPRLS